MVQTIKKVIKRILCKKVNKHKGIHHCPVCDSENINMTPLDIYYFQKWYDNRYIHNITFLETINFSNYSCPNCGASDRARLYAIFFNETLSKVKANFSILDIAPDNSLRKHLTLKYPIDYRSADLYREDVDDKVDITNMELYQDSQFDAFICSHVLEHIENDSKAIMELYRVLKPGGWGIAMVPIHLDLKISYENANAKTPKERWHFFGQDDHVRVYSKEDFINKLEGAGFSLKQLGIDYFGEKDFNKYAIHPRSILYIVTK